MAVDSVHFGVGNWRMSQKPSRDSDSCGVEWRHTTPPTCQSHSSLPLLLSSTPSYDVWIIELNSSSCKSSRPLLFSFLFFFSFYLFLYSSPSSRPHFIRVATQPRRQSQARSSNSSSSYIYKFLFFLLPAIYSLLSRASPSSSSSSSFFFIDPIKAQQPGREKR
jgi:hypothetical protein